MSEHEQALDALFLVLARHSDTRRGYGVLTWLLDDQKSAAPRRARRLAYLKMVGHLECEFRALFDQWLSWSNGPDFEIIYRRRTESLRLVRQLRRCAWLHFFRILRPERIVELHQRAIGLLSAAREMRSEHPA